MYGEKAEEAEELKLDLLDVKAMYRSQVIILLHSIAAEPKNRALFPKTMKLLYK